MILKQNEATVETYGDIQQNKVSIDPRNAEHIISILSSNLYSNPEQSFLRETISNAVDSHIEAGVTEPIILLMRKNGTSNYSIVIRDYGTGISPERFEQIYKFIGSSTKRTSNDFIGSFGIGRFSALSCADVVNIKSYYNGTLNAYVMTKNGGGIDIDLVASMPTEEHNGVEISILVENLDGYVNGLSQLSYIPNLYVRGEGLDGYLENTYHFQEKINSFNERKIVDYGVFKYNTALVNASYRTEGKIVLGNILYPVDFYKIAPVMGLTASILSNIAYNIQIPFNIGDLDVTPNREALLYSPRTVENLKKGYTAFLENIIVKYNDILQNNPNIINYWIQTRCNRSLTLDKDEVSIGIKIPKDLVRSSDLKFRGKVLSENAMECLDRIMYRGLEHTPILMVISSEKGVLTSTQRYKLDLRDIFTKTNPQNNLKILRTSVQIVQIGDESIAKSKLIRSYLTQKYSTNKYNYVLFVPKHSVQEWYKDCLKRILFTYGSSTLAYFNIKEFLRAISTFVITDDIVNSEEYKKWREYRKDSLKKSASTVTTIDKPVFVYVRYGSSYRYYFDFKGLDYFNKCLVRETCWDEQTRNLPVLYGELHSKYWDIFNEVSSLKTKKRFLIVQTAKSNMKYFKELPKKWIPIEEYLPRMKEFKDYLTYRKFITTAPDMKELAGDYTIDVFMNNISAFVSEFDRQAILKGRKFVAPNFTQEDCPYLNAILKRAKEITGDYRLVYNSTFKKELETYYKYLKLGQRVKDAGFANHSPIMTAYILMKAKLIRMNYIEYGKIVEIIRKLKIKV